MSHNVVSIGHSIKKTYKILKMDELRNVTLRKNLLRFKTFKLSDLLASNKSRYFAQLRPIIV